LWVGRAWVKRVRRGGVVARCEIVATWSVFPERLIGKGAATGGLVPGCWGIATGGVSRQSRGACGASRARCARIQRTVVRGGGPQLSRVGRGFRVLRESAYRLAKELRQRWCFGVAMID
jgi:hypothetical protein